MQRIFHGPTLVRTLFAAFLAALLTVAARPAQAADAQADAVIGDRDGDGGWIDGKRRMHVRGMGVLRDVYQRLAEGLMDGVFDGQRGRRRAVALPGHARTLRA